MQSPTSPAGTFAKPAFALHVTYYCSFSLPIRPGTHISTYYSLSCTLHSAPPLPPAPPSSLPAPSKRRANIVQPIFPTRPTVGSCDQLEGHTVPTDEERASKRRAAHNATRTRPVLIDPLSVSTWSLKQEPSAACSTDPLSLPTSTTSTPLSSLGRSTKISEGPRRREPSCKQKPAIPGSTTGKRGSDREDLQCHPTHRPRRTDLSPITVNPRLSLSPRATAASRVRPHPTPACSDGIRIPISHLHRHHY